MGMDDKVEKLTNDIKRFLEVYQVLNPESKAYFESQFEASLKTMDNITRKLYQTLLSSAKLGLGVEETVSAMKEALSSL